MSTKKPSFQVSSTTGGGSIADELMGGTGGYQAPPPPPSPPSPPAPPAPPEAPQPQETAARKRVPIRVHVPEELADRVRGAVAALSYRVDGWSSLNAATAAALEQFVTEAERTHNNGEQFPWSKGRQLQPGRKVGY